MIYEKHEVVYGSVAKQRYMDRNKQSGDVRRVSL